MCKGTLGASSNGLIHNAWLYGGSEIACDLVSNIQFIANAFLNECSFTIGVKDCVQSNESYKQVRSIISEQLEKVPSMKEESEIINVLNKARDLSGKFIQSNLNTSNNLYTMVSGGSKGSIINISQIMACVGQQNVNGARVDNGYENRTLPHFPQFDKGPESKGFVQHSYIEGLKPAEFFFHAMGGREGVIDTAIKTSETGYIQRRLIKSMEDIVICFDHTVRNSIGDILQFEYGEDGYDATRLISQNISFLQEYDINTKVHLPINVDMLIQKVDAMVGKGCTPIPSYFIQKLVANKTPLIKVILEHCLRDKLWTNAQLDYLKDKLDLYIQKAIVHPGEMVGTIAAQSLGQPITQMTLNTFHTSGCGNKNVTMGVPRLKELINLTKNLKNPSMMICTYYEIPNNAIFVGNVLKTYVNEWFIYSKYATLEFENIYLELMDESHLYQSLDDTFWSIHLMINPTMLKKYNITLLDLTIIINRDSDVIWCSCNCENEDSPQIIIRIFSNHGGFDEYHKVYQYTKKLLFETLVQGYKNITETYPVISTDNYHYIETTGTDLKNIFVNPLVNPYKTYSNDVNEIYECLGIEAAKTSLINDIKHMVASEIQQNNRTNHEWNFNKSWENKEYKDQD